MNVGHPFRVVYSGQLRDGFEPEQVKRDLAARLRLSQEKIATFFTGEKRTLKHVDTREKANHFAELFNMVGLQTVVEPLGEVEQAAPAAPLPAIKPFRFQWLYRPALFAAVFVEVLWLLAFVVLLPTLLTVLLDPQFFGTWLFEQVGNIYAATAAYTLTLLLAVPLVALLAKPLLSARQPEYPTVPLSAEREPDIYLFVDDVCDAIGVRPPCEISLSHDAAISVRFHHHPRYGLWEGGSVLVLGLPLLASLNARQLAGAVAQAMHGWGTPMAPRAARFFERNFDWLHRAANSHDWVDQRIERWAEGAGANAHLIASLRRIIAWSRLPVQMHLRLSRLLAERLFHYRITQADAAARHLAGNGDFRKMLEQGRVLALAAQQTIPTLTHMWQTRGELPDNIAMAVIAQASHFGPVIHDTLRAEQERDIAATFDMRPSDRQRLNFLDRQQEDGGYRCDSPAKVLLRRFDKLTHSTTMRYYHKHLHLPVTTNQLIRTPAKGSQEYNAGKYIDSYFGSIHADWVPLRLGQRYQATAEEGAEVMSQWREAAAQMMQQHGKAAAALTQLHRTDDDLIAVSNREAMHRAGIGFHLGELPLRKRHMETIHETCRAYEGKYDAALNDAALAATPYVRRLTAALRQLSAPEVAAQLADAPRLQAEVEHLLKTFERIEQIYPQLRSLRLSNLLLESLLSHDSYRARSRLRDLIIEKSDDVARLVKALDVALRQVQFPFPAARHYKNVMQWVLRDAYGDGTAAAVFDSGVDTVRNLTLLQRLILGRLCAIAVHVEKACRL